MPTLNTGWRWARSAINVDRDGKSAWSNPSLATGPHDTEGATNSIAASTYSDWIRCTDFGIDLPIGCTISGIELRLSVDGYDGFGIFYDNAIYLRKTSGQVGDNKASAEDGWYGGAVEMYVEWRGSASDTWNAGLTREDIISSDFGVDISVENRDASTTFEVRLCQVAIKITYSCDNATDFTLTNSGSVIARSGSEVTWTNPTYIELQDTSYATITFSSSATIGGYSDWIVANDFGFNVPTDCPILGVLVEFSGITISANRWRICTDYIGLLDNTGSGIGINQVNSWVYDPVAVPTGWPVGNTVADTPTYGGAHNKWGAYLTPDIVNSPNFGVRISLKNTETQTMSLQYWMNYVKMVIFYGEPAREYSPIPRFLRGF